MESFFVRLKNPLVLIAILLVQTIALALQIQRPSDPANPEGPQVRLLRLWTLSLLLPLERATHGSGHGIRSAWSNYIDLRHVRRQNDDLRREVADLRIQRASLAEDAISAQRLQQLLGFSQHYVARTVAAQVIGTSGSDQSRMLTLNKGRNDGLAPGMPVITPDGLAGRLRDVFPSSSQLLLINDQTSGAGVMLASTRIRGILRGSEAGSLEINNLTPDSRIKAGEVVLTSGGDRAYPRGLPVGTIVRVGPDPEHPPYAMIVLKPAVNLERLEEVLVVVESAATLDARSQAELSAEAAAHAAARGAGASAGASARLAPPAQAAAPVVPEDQLSTSEANSARLPGMHVDAAPGSTAADELPPPENSTKLVPKPRPVVHPDRYSPGSTLPAGQLKPGGGH